MTVSSVMDTLPPAALGFNSPWGKYRRRYRAETGVSKSMASGSMALLAAWWVTVCTWVQV